MLDIRFKILLIISFVVILATGFIPKPTPQDTTVYAFLSETCPICQSYTLTLKQLDTKYKNKHIRIVGVFPNYSSTQKRDRKSVV